MIDPVRQRQLDELEEVEIGHGILMNARNELYINFRYLDVALSSFVFEADRKGNVLSTDGFVIYYQPDLLFSMYKSSRILVNRAYLHMLFHCLFNHLNGKGNRDKILWDVACDIAIESILDSFYVKPVYRHQSPYRREIYGRITARRKVFTAEGIYKDLTEMNLTQEELLRMAGEFYVDSHDRWDEDEDPRVSTQRQNQWQEMREKMETEMESFGEENAQSGKDLLEQIKAENRERYDYKRFLKKFAVLREEAEVDPDSFDPIFYTYGMTLYENMPLIEPLETREVFKIEDFVIAIDTSMSVSGDLVKRFLEETYGMLSESESYFRKVNIHIIQCDEEIRSDVTITSREEMEDYMEHFTISGFGGTDFRPAFEYVNGLLNKGVFKKLRGLLYFTDGKGIYPVAMPPYDTAFVFMEGQYEDISVPGWAMKVILTEEDLNLS
ncbi:VWA-like domain-containing protein [Lacrimispora xylanolytica]|uniref:VWA-like domain-containing protein n=1 Tax=Lacrimispora xylanolytica TaxID=29375 RepID=A0ABY7AI83_9FIRM|nr:VWA-like domain-containing protein [Lacrimispora xylanolytica]MBS5958065.1 metallopeptidase [Clostridiales bacterium]WAJ26089.1 VWA-like domain-containing protein [Lacrimispora xylanolytica]